MKANVIVTSVEPTQYTSPLLEDISGQMTEAELAQAQVRGWLIKGVEPGSDDVWQFRIAADNAPKDLPQQSFRPFEIECRGVSGKGWIRTGQTKGSVDATITFQAVGMKPIDFAVLQAENEAHAKRAEADSKQRQVQREMLSALRAKVEARLKGVAITTGGK